MEKAIIMKALFTAFTIGSTKLPLQAKQARLPFFSSTRSLYETYISGTHIFHNRSLLQELRAGDILDTMYATDDMSSIMILHRQQALGFLPIYELEQRIQLHNHEYLKVKIKEIDLSKPSWEQIRIEVLACAG